MMIFVLFAATTTLLLGTAHLLLTVRPVAVVACRST
jgi:hypothetical protein